MQRVCLVLATLISSITAPLAQQFDFKNFQAQGVKEITITGTGFDELPEYVKNLKVIDTLRFHQSDIPEIVGLENFYYLNNLEITENTAALKITGLALPHMGTVNVSSNNSLGIASIASLWSAETVNIESNANLQHFNAAAEQVDTYTVKNNPRLTNLNLRIGKIESELKIEGNTKLERLDLAIDRMASNYEVVGEPALKNLSLQFGHLGGDIAVKDNLLLEGINGKFENVEGDITISNNPLMTSLWAFSIEGHTAELNIINNPSLSLLRTWQWQNFTGNLKIIDNPLMNWSSMVPANFEGEKRTPWMRVKSASLINSAIEDDNLLWFGPTPGQLVFLDISNNHKISKLPNGFAWSRLENLNLSGTGISEIPPVLSYMQRLETLNMTDTCLEKSNYGVFHTAFSPLIDNILPLPVDYQQGAHCTAP